LYLLSILCVASLFGGMLLFAGGFGTLAFKLLDKATARSLIRNTFPYFYLYVLVNSGLAAVLSLFGSKISFVLLALIFVTTIPNRQFLMPAINNAADTGNKKRWGMLHGLSVIITLAHIVLAGAALGYLL
tara:strand:+ start:99 stop:488 length:390 start_codon:yes stop_codon:yes gene_type:complete